MNAPVSRHLSALAIARLLGDESAGAGGDERAHLEGCAECRAQLDEARAAAADFTSRVFPRTLPAIASRRKPWWRRPWLAVALPTLAAATVALLILLRPPPQHVPDLRPKGGSSLEVYALRDGRVFQVSDGDVLHPGDSIRFVVHPAGKRFLLVTSVDGAGAVTIYHPFGGVQSAPLPDGARVELDGSIVLDDALGPERIFAVFSDTPVLSAGVTAALAGVAARGHDAIRAATPPTLTGSPLADPAGVTTTILLEKRSR